MAEPIKVAVTGYRGKVGSVLAGAFQSEPGFEYVGGVELGDDLAAFLNEKRPRAVVDFTQPSEALHNALAAGSVLMMHLADIAAPHFDAVEVIEMHHATKLDAPSGTALSTARRLAARRRDKPFTHKKAEKETLAGTRGGEEGNVAVHSVRLPGFVADQEVIFGLPGQTLTIVHRTTSREAYIPGVLLAIRKVTSEPRFYRGLDELLGLRLG